MTLGEKIYKLRTERGMSQEAFGEALRVSRQSVSKWETDQSSPELDKIVAISEMFMVSTDYLLKENIEHQPAGELGGAVRADMNNVGGDYTQGQQVIVQRSTFSYEYKSKKTFMGLPLVHVHFGLKPLRAKGIIAIGNVAQGVIAVGIVGLGVITLAPVGVGLLLAVGMLVVGGMSFGTFAVGVIAGGAVSVGVFTMGAVAVGEFSFGALAMGHQIAIGDAAYGNIALGFSEASGAIYEEVRAADGSFDSQAMIDAIDANVSGHWHIFVSWMKMIIRLMAST